MIALKIAAFSSFMIAAAAGELDRYKIKDVTVSGLSAGAYMAVQMHISHSKTINGSAIFAGGPFYCAESNLMYAEYRCMDTTLGTPQTAKLVSLTIEDAGLGLIDDPKFLKDDRVYLFSGAGDTVVDQAVVESLQDYYKAFISPGNIVADYSVRAEHCMPTLTYGEACDRLSSPYLGKCAFDGAGVALSAIYGEENLVKPTLAKESNLRKFSQTGYFKGARTSIGDFGYIYVPDACADGRTECRLHVSFHGCQQTLGDIGNAYAAHSGYNEWAESNKIIVLYPYVEKSLSSPQNPNGCWDWWAYTGVDYGVKTGVQVSFVKSMIDDLAGL